jgi:hypothetical protein
VASLRLFGVTEVAWVNACRLRDPWMDESLIGSALLRDAEGALRPYLVLRPEYNLYAVRPDGSDLHRVLISQSCFLSHVGSSFSPDGRGSCAAVGIVSTCRSPASPVAARKHRGRCSRSPSTADWADLAWSADGRQVAVAMAGAPCTVSLFYLTLTPPPCA